MQKRAISDNITIDYAPFDSFFREDGGRVHHGYHCPPMHPIRDLHHHDALELGYCLEGSGVFWIDGALIPYTAPCASLIFPGQLHKARSTGAQLSRWMFATIRPPESMPRGVEGGVFTEPGLLSLAAQVVAECDAELAGYESCARCLIAAITIKYARTAGRKDEGAGERRYLMERLQPVLNYIAENYALPLDAERLSELLFVHPSTLRMWFHRTLGITPMQYVHRTRVSMACALLQSTTLSVAEIAQNVGYTTISSFNRQFLDICGCSPVAYRRRAAAARRET